jgi:hypothetical protein
LITGHVNTHSGWKPCHERYADEDAGAVDNPWNEVTDDAQCAEQSEHAEDTLSFSKDDLDRSVDATKRHTRG